MITRNLENFKNKFDNFIINLSFLNFIRIIFYGGFFIGISYRIYVDGFNFNLLYPSWMVNSKINMIQLFFLAIFGGLIGALFGSYVSHMKFKYNYLD